MTRLKRRFGVLPSGASADDFIGMLEEFGEVGYWHVDLTSNSIFWSAQVCAIHGVEDGYSPPSLEDAIEWYHEDDRDDVVAAVRDARQSGQPFHFTHRIVSASDQVRWVESRGNIRRDETGAAETLFGTFRDVTDQREASVFNSRVRSAINHMDDGFAIFDPDDRLYLCNEQYRRLYPENMAAIKIGATFEDMIRAGFEVGQYLDGIGREDAYLEERKRQHRDPSGPYEQRLPHDRWIRVSEAVTDDGSRVGFRMDITAMKSLQQQLVEKASEAMAASQLKDKFLANMSHELRTPLNAVIGFAQLIQMMQAQGTVDEQIAGYAGDIESSGAHLLEIIEDIIRLAQMQAEATKVTMEAVSVADIFDDVRALTASVAEKYQQSLVYDLPASCAWQISAEQSKIVKVLVNLVTNAIKFSPAGSTVLIQAELRDDSDVFISVIDEGSGIPERLQEKIFERFERLEACSEAIEGIGVGLSIARELVDIMGGELGVISAEGEGSTFWMSFPLASAGRLACASVA